MKAKWSIRLTVIGLLTVLFLQTVFAMRFKSPTADELTHHVSSGYSYWMRRDFRMNPASPPLPRLLSSLPLVIMKLNFPTGPAWEAADSPAFAQDLFYRSNQGMEHFLFWSRMPIVLLSLFFAWAVFYFAKIFFGEWAAVASLALYVFCPDIVAHSGLATADLAVAFFFFLALMSFASWLRTPGLPGVYRTGVLTGLALLSKFSAILLFPIFLVAGIITGRGRFFSIRNIIIFSSVCLFTVWAGYFFEMKPVLSHVTHVEAKTEFVRELGGESMVEFARKTPVPLATFFSAVAGMTHTRGEGTRAFLMGEWSRQGWWYYYPVAFAVKNTIPLLLLFILSLAFLSRLGLDKLGKVILILPILFFFLVTFRDKAQAGIRYFLPIYPLIFILGGGVSAYLWKKKAFFKAVVVVFMVWHAAEALRIFPHHLAYFNQLAGGPQNGYKVLRDSNLDWGQDMKLLGELVQKEKYPEVVLAFHQSADPAYYGIPSRSATPDEFNNPKKTVYALGAHFLEGFEWTRGARPTHVLGHSVFVYDLREKL
ncbi:MAG: glycosyltransferase family 39 protein [Candidatus Omnitrophica bacterium]|nr:glycosyltransferase family 39 protein [Candidatus Omnitrophota bacterium]